METFYWIKPDGSKVELTGQMVSTSATRETRIELLFPDTTVNHQWLVDIQSFPAKHEHLFSIPDKWFGNWVSSSIIGHSELTGSYVSVIQSCDWPKTIVLEGFDTVFGGMRPKLCGTDCPICGTGLHRVNSITYYTNPPSFHASCDQCGHWGVINITSKPNNF